MFYGLVFVAIILVVVRFFVLMLYLREGPQPAMADEGLSAEIPTKKKPKKKKVSIMDRFLKRNQKKEKEKELKNIDVDLQLGEDYGDRISTEDVGVKTRKFNNDIFEQMEEIGGIGDEPIGLGKGFEEQQKEAESRPLSEKYPELIKGFDEGIESNESRVFNKKDPVRESDDIGTIEVGSGEETSANDLLNEMNQAEKEQSTGGFDFDNYFNTERESSAKGIKEEENEEEEDFLKRFGGIGSDHDDYKESQASSITEEAEREPQKPAFLDLDREKHRDRDLGEKKVEPPKEEKPEDDLLSLREKFEQLKQNVDRIKE